MNLYVPVLEKIKYSVGVDVERTLPAMGDIVVKKGDKVVPFTKIGRAKVSKESFELPTKIKLYKNNSTDMFFYKDDKIGRVGLKKLVAPYNGKIVQDKNKLVFHQEERDIWILAGLWGEVNEVIDGTLVKIKTQVADFKLVAFCQGYSMGELVVFPNPSELLDVEYLKNFTKGTHNKIIYVGNHIRKEVIDLAAHLSISALIGGSILKENFIYAQTKNVTVGITTGFGKFNTAVHVFDFLKGVSNRHVFFDGYNGLVRVPIPADKLVTENGAHKKIKNLAIGDEVYILENPNFGSLGKIEGIQEQTVYVTLNKSGEKITVKWPNLYILI